MRLFKVVFVILLLRVASAVTAQNNFLPHPLPDFINTSFDEVSPALSPDGAVLFFSRLRHPSQRKETVAGIWYSEKIGGVWTAPVLVNELNTGRRNYVISVLGRADQVLISVDGVMKVAHHLNGSWITGTALPFQNDILSVAADTSNRVWVSRGKVFFRSNGMTSEINSPRDFRIRQLHLTTDQKNIYASSKRRKKGSFYGMRRSADGTWQTPVLLSDSVNSTYRDECLRTNGVGSVAVFSSRRTKGMGNDLFIVKLFEDKPWLSLHGTIHNSVSGRPVVNRRVALRIDGNDVHASRYSADSGTYTLNVPFGCEVTVAAVADNYSSIPVTVSTAGMTEFSERKMSLQLQPLPYVRISGKLLVKNTDSIIPAYAEANIFVDGETAGRAIVNHHTGDYSLEIPHGTAYYLHVSGRHFESLPMLVDLTHVDAYEEIRIDLHADAEKMAVVSGRVMVGSVPATVCQQKNIHVEGVPDPVLAYDDISSEFELRLPLKRSHVISAHVPGFCPVYEVIDVTDQAGDVHIRRNLSIVPFATGSVVRLNRVAFQTGKSILDPSSYPELDDLAAFMREHPTLRIEIGAHTHSSEKISTLLMAKAVCSYLITRGVPPNRMSCRGYSCTKPVVPHQSPDAKAINRRVEYTITGM